MAFPFLKKGDNKMQARPAVKPKSPVAPAPQTKPPPVEAQDDDLGDLGDLDFTGIEVVEEVDPLVAAIEQAAVSFANEDDAGTEAILHEAIQAKEKSEDADRLWLMLFDFYRVSGQRDKFSPLELEYAKLFEKQPPVWRDASGGTNTQTKQAGATVFSGELLGKNASGFAKLDELLAGGSKARLDLSKVTDLDGPGCERFLSSMMAARKRKLMPEVLGCEAVREILEPKVKAGDTEQAFWRMLLECYQMQGHESEFDDLAVEFAVTFEISPPSWDASAAPEKKAGKPLAAEKPKRADDAFYLSGEIRGGRLDGLESWVGEHDQVVVDMADVSRLDFASAGAMLNALVPHMQKGHKATLRYPNHLVAELLGPMGIGDVATIIFSKR